MKNKEWLIAKQIYDTLREDGFSDKLARGVAYKKIEVHSTYTQLRRERTLFDKD